MNAPSINLDTVLGHAANQISTDLESDIVILNLSDGVYYGLNDVGSFVWNHVASPKSLREICNAVAEEYEVDEAVCRQDVCELIDDLLSKNLIEVLE